MVARAPFLAAQRGERIGIVGPNGAGKTTLLRTIAGELPPLDGAISFGHNTQLGYLAQLRGSAIPGATVLDALVEAIPVTPGEARGYLARFLFRGDDVFKEVRQLSGGERSRLELALLGIQASNLLLLDEPTNHLDIAAREAIEGFLVESPATLLIVSHDRRLLETVCDRLWVVGDGLAVPFDGGYRAWRAALGDGWTTKAAAGGRGSPSQGRCGRAGRRACCCRGGSCPAGRRIDREAGGTAAEYASGQAFEGRLPAPEGIGRGRTDAPRPAQEPPRAVPRRPCGRRELRGGPPHLERAGGHRAGSRGCGGRLARGRGASAMRTVRIGLTGPIGCGKSTVAGMLAEHGAVVIDADRLVREVYEDAAVRAAVVERFGPAVRASDGSIDRRALARIVFDDPAALRDLEAIIHPAVRPRILAGIDAADTSRARAVVVEAIKLVESGLAGLCDEVWLVTCDPPIQRGRLRDRGIPDDDADRRIAAQRHLRDRVEPVATRRIDTSGTLAETRTDVARAWSKINR